MNAAIARYTKQAVEARGWQAGSSLENRFALRLARLGLRPIDLVQQHRVGTYRIDFADPDVLIGIEADGFYHQMPGAADRDCRRDQALLEQGWFVFRVTDCDDAELEKQLLAVVLLLREERIYQGLPWKREAVNRKTPKPSRLALAAGHRPKRKAA